MHAVGCINVNPWRCVRS